MGKIKNLAILAVFFSHSAFAQNEPMIGLLSLPKVLGKYVCEKFTPQDITIYENPLSNKPIGKISVKKNWEFHDIGGCGGLEVINIINEKNIVDTFPTKEPSYEEQSAIVLAKSEGWYKIQLSDGAGWIKTPKNSTFYPMEELLTNNLPHLTDTWDGKIYKTPSDKAMQINNDIEYSIEVIGSKTINNNLWINVKFQEEQCGINHKMPQNIDSGWIKAYDKEKKLNISYYSRGC